MKKRNLALILIVLLLGVAALGGCASQESSTPEAQQITVTDTLGREVAVTTPVDAVVAVGPGSLRLYCYVNGMDKVVGVENFEKKDSTGRPYMLAYPDLANLPVIGSGGPSSTPDAEQIVVVQPDVIFADGSLDKAAADILQDKTGVPVVVLNYGDLGTFNESVYASINMIGEVMGMEQKALEVVDYIKACQQDLEDRVKDIAEENKPTVYVGGLGMRGTHGIQSTQAQFPLFTIVGARNVVDETGETGSLMIDPEKLIEWDPDKIFIDGSGYSLVVQDYEKNPTFYQTLSAYQNGEIYGQLPFNYYATNIDTALADAYYIGKVTYSEQYQDIDPEKKADEIYTFLLGKPVYEQMKADFGGFKKLNLE